MPEIDRPAIHLTAQSGWINDPLGLTWRDGTYHLFFQHVPGRSDWAPNVRWGHATSPDLLHWTEQPIALEPGDGDDGVWSGSVVTNDDGETFLFYTSITEPDFAVGRIRVARPIDDSWIAWAKGPVVAEAPLDAAVVVYRDPFVFCDGKVWRMLVGAAFAGGVAAALSYSSADLLAWQYDGVAAQRAGSLIDPVWTGTMWECPQLVEIAGSHVLVTSVWEDDVLHYVAYGVGAWADGVFTARTWGRLSYGDSYYAPSLFRDQEGRPGLIFWLRGAIAADGATWSSAISAPHLLELRDDVLTARVHPQVQAAARRSPDFAKPIVADHPISFEWAVDRSDRLVVKRNGRPELVISRTSNSIRAESGAASSGVMPTSSGTLEVLIDGPIVELSTDNGVLALI